MIEKAIKIAIKAHEGQKDKSGKAYILHPLRIMSSFKNENEQIIAILHDVIEDSDYTYDDLRNNGFSEDIINAIDSVTKRENENYFDFINRSKKNNLGRKIKIADINDNLDLSRLDNPQKEDYERIEKYKRALDILNN